MTNTDKQGCVDENLTVGELGVVAMPHIDLPRPPTSLSPFTAELMEKHVKPEWQSRVFSQTLPPLKQQQKKTTRAKSKRSPGGTHELPQLPKPASNARPTLDTRKRAHAASRSQAVTASAPDLRTNTSLSSIAEARQRDSIRPSSVACRENRRKEVLTSQVVAAEDGESTRAQRMVEAGLLHRPGSSHRQLENFAVDLERCDHLIRQLAGGAPGTPVQTNHGNATRESAKLSIGHSYNTETGTARHRVADALDNTRIEDTEAVQSAIPMQKIIVEGGYGRERIEVVHVALLRARCAQLMQGASVESLLENLANQKKQSSRLLISPAPSTNVTQSQWHPDVLLDLLVPKKDELRPGTWFQQEYNMRRGLVYKRRMRQKFDQMLRTLRNMRGQLPEHYEQKFAAMSKAVGTDLKRMAPLVSESMRTTNGGEIFWHVSTEDAQKAAKIVAEIDEHRIQQECEGGYSLDDALHAAEQWHIEEEMTRAPTAPAHRRRAAMSYRDADDAVDIIGEEVLAERAKRARRRWRLLRNSFFLVGVFLRIRGQHQAIEIIKAYLAGIGEWSRLKHAWQRLVDGVTRLQRKCREFRIRKGRRCEEIKQEWQRIEDHFLSVYFKIYADKVIAEQAKKRADMSKRRGRRTEASSGQWGIVRAAVQDESNAKPPLVVDWQVFRIPEHIRSEIISMYYTAILRRHIFSQAHLVSIVRQKFQHDMEIQRMVREFGKRGDGAASKQGASKTASSLPTSFVNSEVVKRAAVTPAGHLSVKFWHVSEEMCMNLIAHGAKRVLESSHVRMFEEHPSISTFLESPLHRSEQQLWTTKALLKGKFRLAILRSGVRRLPGGRLLWEEEKKTNEKPVDLDDLLNNFKPHRQEEDDG
mmetsp:Transcript_36673/g.84374  ORF Transcript_36673/g.84374 Transcript_36673/m.84374 type:complete len:871 (+) Transcript_36673:88-2700(+)